MAPPSDLCRRLLAHPALSGSGHLEFLEDEVRKSPDPTAVLQALIRHAEHHALPADRPHLLVLLTLAAQSPFLADLLMQHPSYLPWAAHELSRPELRTPEDLREDLARFRFTLSTLSDAAVLRRFKYREYLRIALRDLLGKQDLAGTTHELSLLADVLLQEAYLLSYRELVGRFGAPQYFDDRGRLAEATFAVLSLGKLGGDELNYSSDIDLVYLFSREGQTEGGADSATPVISNREFFTRLGVGINRRITGISPEGQVFRVDLDLRPGGKDGELVHSRRAFLAYHRTWARNWERQALIKARHSAGDKELGEGVLRELQPSIYPSSGAALGALEIKEMKDRIDDQLSRAGRSELDIKLGAGGLRELEFAVQALQITHGAREPWLHEGNTLRALHRLADKSLVSYGEHSALSRAYDFLRRVEHRLQLDRNLQTALLPSSSDGMRILGRKLGYLQEGPESSAFLGVLDQHRSAIRGFYDSVFGRLAQGSLGHVEEDLLLDPIPHEVLRSFLTAAGAPMPDEAARHLAQIRALFSPERIRPNERREMRRVSAAIVAEAVTASEPERAFTNLERFLSSLLVERQASWVLFKKAGWIPALMRVFGKSEALTQILTRRPLVLEELEDAPDFLREGGVPGRVQQLHASLEQAGESREAAALLRRFHQKEILLIGFRDVHRHDSLSRTLTHLTDLAEACLIEGDLAAARWCPPAGRSLPRFTVLGLGRLGYREMDYNSDLDLIFVSEAEGSDGPDLEAARRRAEVLIHLLTAVTQEGSLYSVDLRLRPAGREGELIQTRAGIVGYFRDQARTWEKLALLKARPVAGDRLLGEEILASIRASVFAETEGATLAAEVREMKQRLEETAEPKGGPFLPLKLGPGGIMDIHFLIEFLQIRHRLPGPPERDTLRMLTYLSGLGLIPADDYSRLYSGYLLLRSLDHAMRLLFDRPGDDLPLSPAILSRLAGEVSLSQDLSRNARGESLRRLVQETLLSIRDSFHRLVR